MIVIVPLNFELTFYLPDLHVTLSATWNYLQAALSSKKSDGVKIIAVIPKVLYLILNYSLGKPNKRLLHFGNRDGSFQMILLSIGSP